VVLMDRAALRVQPEQVPAAKDIGDVLEIPEGTARTRIRRAKQLLEAQLAALAASPALLQSTVSDLESWAGKLRDALKSPK
jgi:hypothetical protein